MTNHDTVEPVEAAAEEEERRQEEAAEEAEKFAAANEATAAGLEALATRDITQAMVSDVVDAASDAPYNQFEMFININTSTQLVKYQSALTDALTDLTPADVTAGHTAILDAVLQLDLSASQPVNGVDAADRVMSQLVIAADPAQAGGVTDPGVTKLAADIKAMTDTTFWYSLGAYFDGERLGPDEAREHLAFLRAAGDLKPMAAADAFKWRSQDAKAFQVDQLLMAGVGSKTGAMDPASGGIDIAAMYRRAATLKGSLGKPVPRQVAAELLRLALAAVHDQPEPTDTETPVEVGREPVTRDLAPDALPAGASPDVQRMRQSAADMLAATEVPKMGMGQLNLGAFRLATQNSTELAWSTGRGAQGEVLDYFVRDLKNRLTGAEGGKATADGITKLLRATGLVDSLNTFSKLNTSDTTTDAQLADAVEDVKKRMKLTVGGFAALDDPNAMGGPSATGIQGMRTLIDSLSVDVAGQVAARIKGEVPPVETRLGGPRAVIDSVGVLGNYRQAAVSSQDGTGLQDFTSAAIGDYKTEKWAKDLLAATGIWDDANTADLDGLAKAAKTLKTALDTARGLKMTSGDRTYFAKVAIDALAYAALDQLTAAKALDLPIQDLDTLISGFRSSLAQQDITTQVVPDPAKIDSAWSNGKKGVKDLPPGLDLNLAGRLSAWRKAAFPSKGQPDLNAASKSALDIAEAVADYRRRIQNTPDKTTSPVSKATLLQLLDGIVGSVSQRLSAIDA